MVFGIKRAEKALRKHLQLDQPAAPYVYTPLAEDNNEIRVLSIYPGKFKDDIYVDLLAIPFAAEHTQAYEALSYTWGSPDHPPNIRIRHGKASCILSVTQNCEEALRYLRFKDLPRTVWIDAICINQGDLKERARQVSIMRSIYFKASRVIVWIGPSSHNSRLAMQWIDTVGKEVAFDRNTLSFHSLTADTKMAQSTDALVSEAESAAFDSLLARSYFDRLWVWQEVRMGRHVAVLQCGTDQTLFQRFMTAVAYWSYNGDRTAPVLSTRRRVNFIGEMPVEVECGGLESLGLLRSCNCTDQRDRIYTSIAFGEKLAELEIKPDYEKTVVEVYSEYILKYVDTRPDLHFLLNVGDDSLRDGSTGIEGLPSWVPDWSRLNTIYRFSLGLSEGNSKASIIYADSDYLAVRGLQVGKVRRCFYFGMDTLLDMTRAETHTAFCTGLQVMLPEGIGEDLSHQLVRTLTADDYSERFIPPRSLATFNECQEYLVNALADSDEWISNDDESTADYQFRFCRGRSLFLTDNGKLGLGPHDVQEGDYVALLLGCDTLMTLRPSDSKTGFYSVIGSALCTGMNDGEGILGPLPPQYEVVEVCTDEGGFYLAFRDKSTSEVTYEDPRLPPLSSHWIRILDNSESPIAYENKRTGELRWYRHDPRMDADALESRGVKLEAFWLV